MTAKKIGGLALAVAAASTAGRLMGDHPLERDERHGIGSDVGSKPVTIEVVRNDHCARVSEPR